MTYGIRKIHGARIKQNRTHGPDIRTSETLESTFYTAVIADALDELGQHDRAMREYVRPLSPEMTFAGWARTILCQDTFYVPEDPYGLEIESVDSILPGEVVVVSTGESKRYAPW